MARFLELATIQSVLNRVGRNMKRRSEGGHPIKRRLHRAVGHKAPKGRTEDRFTTDLQAQVDILTRELKESREEQMATADVLQAISQSTFDLQTVLDALVKAASRLCSANTEIFRRIGDGYRLSASCGFSRAYNEYVGSLHILPGKETLAGRTAHEGRTVHIPDVFADPDYNLPEAQKLGHWRAMLGIPLLREGIAVGVFAFKRPAAGSFTKAEIELAKTFANQALIAIENTRLLNELRESLQQQTATANVLRIISASPGELESVFSAILQNATHICEARFGTLYRFDGRAFYHAAGHETPRALVEVQKRQGRFVPDPGTLMHRVMQTRAAAHSADYAAESAPGLSAKFGGARSTVVVPMLKDNELVGAFAIYRQEVRPFTEKQIALLENFAAQAVIAIENARLLSELRESLQQQTATADVLKVISSSRGELEPVFQAMLENATRVCQAKRGFLFRAEGEGFRVAASLGERSTLSSR